MSTLDQKSATGFDLNGCVLHLLHRAQQAADEAFAAAFADTGLTPRQLAVLVVVGEREGTNQVGLVDATGIDRSTTADQVSAASGLICLISSCVFAPTRL